MIKATRVDKTIICVIKGKMYQKTFHSDEEIMSVYEQALNTDESDSSEVEELKAMFLPSLTSEEAKEKREIEEHNAKEIEEHEKSKDLMEWLDQSNELEDKDFEVIENKLYMKGINITIPEFLAREFAKRRNNDEDLESLKNFWRLCALNPDPRCREDLYKFLINNNMVVTPSGYFMAYRNANVKEEGTNRELYEFVEAAYIKLKSQKKGPNSFLAYYDKEKEEYFYKHKTVSTGLVPAGSIGALKESLSENKESTSIYTDAHSGETTIKIGEPVSIPREECDSNPDQTCSRGLHLGSTNFMSQGYYGQVGLVCLCNPMRVVAVPYTGGQKLRTSEYLPVGVAEYDEDGKIIPIDTHTFEYEYSEHTQEQLEDMLANSSFESLKEHQILPKELRLRDFKLMTGEITDLTQEMSETVKNRTTKAE